MCDRSRLRSVSLHGSRQPSLRLFSLALLILGMASLSSCGGAPLKNAANPGSRDASGSAGTAPNASNPQAPPASMPQNPQHDAAQRAAIITTAQAPATLQPGDAKQQINQQFASAQANVSADNPVSESNLNKPADQANPTAPVNPENSTETYAKLNDNPFLPVQGSPLSTFAIDVDTASYSNVRRFLNGGSLPPADAVRIEEMLNYFPYDYPQPQGDKPFSVTTEVANAPWNPNHKLVQIGLQGKRLVIEKLPPNNLVFLLDVSGSMAEPNRLPLLKSSLQLMVNELRPEDRVAIVVYAGNAGLVLPSTPGNQKDKILNALTQLDAGGSTAGGEGIELAYKIAKEQFLAKGNNRVILATDGDFNVGPSSDEDLVKLIEQKRSQGIFLTVLGLGMGNIQDAKLEALADKGNGNYAYIDSLSEAKKVLVKEMGATLFTIAKDVKVQVGFNPDQVQAYRLIGYENRMLAAQDFDDDRKDAGEIGAGHAVTALYEVIPKGMKVDVELPMIDPDSAQISLARGVRFGGQDLMQVKLRYKAPKANESQLQTFPIAVSGTAIAQASPNLRFASSVAAFGMVLRESPYRGKATLAMARELAAQSQGADLDGYRAEFMRLVETSQRLKGG
jgi:Ca-activated chloride channel homolog